MKKRRDIQKKPNFNVIFIVIVIIILAVAVYLAFISPVIQFSPDNSVQIARAVVGAIGPDGCNWLKGKKSVISDGQGGQYDQAYAKQVVASLGGVKIVNRACKGVGTTTRTLVCNSNILGDINGDGRVDLADPVGITNYLSRGTQILCLNNADVNGDRRVDLADARYLEDYLLRGGSAPGLSSRQGTQPTKQPSPSSTGSP